MAYFCLFSIQINQMRNGYLYENNHLNHHEPPFTDPCVCCCISMPDPAGLFQLGSHEHTIVSEVMASPQPGSAALPETFAILNRSWHPKIPMI
jgi:hypothetical protein